MAQAHPFTFPRSAEVERTPHRPPIVRRDVQGGQRIAQARRVEDPGRVEAADQGRDDLGRDLGVVGWARRPPPRSGSGSEADETHQTGKGTVPARSERLCRPIPSPTTTRSGPSPGPRRSGALARKAAIIRRAGSPWTGRTTQVV